MRFRKLFEAYPDGEHGKEAITHYKVLERFNYVTLVNAFWKQDAPTRYGCI